jgi:predicted nucleotidyltransferase component of viral defense system
VKERALEIVASRSDGVDGLNVLREYVQYRILGAMQEGGAFIPLAFMGGTALRFRYRIARFSEDLDFTLERKAETFDFSRLADRIERGLTREGYQIRTARSDKTAVKKATIGFVGLPAQAGLSPHADAVLKVRLEVDTNPPAGATLETPVINRFGPLRLQFHDLPSLFAGKTAAVLARGYSKGRDFYDLAWYLSQQPQPEMNVELLRNALLQTAPELAEAAAQDWREALRRRIAEVNWDDAWRDVAPFLESRGRDRDLYSRETFEGLLGP